MSPTSLIQALSDLLMETGDADLATIAGLMASAEQKPRTRAPEACRPMVCLAESLSHPEALPVVAEILNHSTIPVPGHLSALGSYIDWTEGNFDKPPIIAGRYMYCVLGESAAVRFGLYLQMPHAAYPSHAHAAQELYIPLSGTALWQQSHRPFQAKPPGSIIRHAPYEAHATQTQSTPLLAFWAWTGNLDPNTYRIEAAAAEA